MFISTRQNLREYALVLAVAAAAAAVGAGAIFLSQHAANAPSSQKVQLVSDAATGGGYPSASTSSVEKSYVIESDRGIIVVGPKASAPASYVIESDRGIIVVGPKPLQQTSDAASGAGYAQADQSDVLSRYIANTAAGPELVSDAALSH